MKKFNYQAKDKKGKFLKGVVEATSDKQAIALLHERGLTVVSLRVIEEKNGLMVPFTAKDLSDLEYYDKRKDLGYGTLIIFEQTSHMSARGISLNRFDLVFTNDGGYYSGIMINRKKLLDILDS